MRLPPDIGPLLTADDFAPFVSGVFRIEGASEDVEIQLDSVERHSRQDWMPREPFTLIFSTPRDVLVEEGTYRMRAEGGAPVELHVMPILSMPSERQLYQAIFN